MKKLLLLPLLLNFFISNAQTTAIPDADFEQSLIDLGLDSGFPDGTVPTVNIDTVISLNVGGGTITDLTGIAEFTALETLLCYFNNLNSIDVTQNLALTWLNCVGNNITSLDLSQNTLLTQLASSSNPLTCLNVKNGFNTNITAFYTDNCPNLACIEVDNVSWSTTNWIVANGNIDATASFSINCGVSCSPVGINEISPNALNIHPNPTSSQLTILLEEITPASITIRNSLGQLLLSEKHPSSNEVVLDISSYPTGIYFLQLEVNGKVITKKVIKQ